MTSIPFAKHLPPSARPPRVWVLDAGKPVELPADVERVAAGPSGDLDAVAGFAGPERLAELAGQLRPGGRLILAHPSPPEALLAALTAAGLIHCLVEPHGGYVLYRGERPSAGTSVERVQALAAPAEAARHGSFVYLLVQQTPNQPAWQLAPGQPVDWLAATIVDPATGEPALLAFSSLVRAVAFMQSAVRVSFLININKIGKFPAAAAGGWAHPTLTDPDFAAVRAWRLGPRLAVDRHQAVTGDE